MHRGYIELNIQHEVHPTVIFYNIQKHINEDAYVMITHW